MNAIILREPGRLVHADQPEPPAPGPWEAVVRVRSIGICGTDLHAFRGRQPFFTYPRMLGHELGVEVVAVGEEVRNVFVGTRCALEPYFNCDRCSACRRGKTNCCSNLKVFGVHIDGGMREFAVVPAYKLHAARSLSFDQLALVEPLAIGAHAVARGAPQPDETVLVIGAGPIGMAVTQFALLAGARVLVIDVDPERLTRCRDRWPEVTPVEGGDNPEQALREVLGGELPTAVFDATGNPKSMAAAFRYPEQGGRLIFVGLFQGDVTFHDPEFHRRELTLLSSRNALAEDFRRIIGAMESGALDTTGWITHRAGFDELIERFPDWLEPGNGVLKAMITV
jgi:2-desacetyl-2-hydroxyethyl bacteriochlorophyllide A dehydrogenase